MPCELALTSALLITANMKVMDMKIMKNYTPPKTTFIVGNKKKRAVCVFYLYRHDVMVASLSSYDSNSKKKISQDISEKLYST